MKSTMRLKLTALLCAGTMAMQASAHHSVAQFDTTKITTVKGTVARFQWSNPHVFIQLLVDDGAGKTTEWSIEMPNTAGMTRIGWHGNTLKPGDKITVSLNPLRSGGPGGFGQQVVTADGRTLGQTDLQEKRVKDATESGGASGAPYP